MSSATNWASAPIVPPRLTASQLSSLLLNPSESSKIAVIDVRDDDHIGGHIKNSTNVPSSTLDHALPALVRKMADKEIVVFHCALSQVRGPKAAARYLRERERVLGIPAAGQGEIGQALKKSAVETEGERGYEKEGPWEGVEKKGEGEKKDDVKKVQEVYVLERGFEGWHEVYGKDERLTEGYNEELWGDY